MSDESGLQIVWFFEDLIETEERKRCCKVCGQKLVERSLHYEFCSRCIPDNEFSHLADCNTLMFCDSIYKRTTSSL